MTTTEEISDVVEIYKDLATILTVVKELTQTSLDFNNTIETHRKVIDLLVRRISDLEKSDAARRDQISVLNGEIAMLRSMVDELRTK